MIKTIIHHPIVDGLYHPFMVNFGVYYCFNHIIPYVVCYIMIMIYIYMIMMMRLDDDDPIMNYRYCWYELLSV